jgi:hypothetical protein
LAAILGLLVFAAGCQRRKPAPAKPIAPAGPPQLWAVAVTDIRPASVRVSWTTDRPAKSAADAIHEGKPPKFEPRQRLSTALEKIHILTLTGLRPGERYWVRVISEDAQGRRGEADYGTVIPREIPVRHRVRFEGATILGAGCGIPGPAFQSNTRYWIQDRYAPLVWAAREAADEVGADIRLMAAGWNHDYNGGRGDLLFQVGAHRVLDAYGFHCYVAKPLSFEAWRPLQNKKHGGGIPPPNTNAEKATLGGR